MNLVLNVHILEMERIIIVFNVRIMKAIILKKMMLIKIVIPKMKLKEIITLIMLQININYVMKNVLNAQDLGKINVLNVIIQMDIISKRVI